jgi:hypothetical protein
MRSAVWPAPIGRLMPENVITPWLIDQQYPL